MTKMHLGRLPAIVVTMMLLAAACGGGASDGDPASIPPNNNPGETPGFSSACIEGEPDCDDTLVVGDEPQDLPNEGGEPVVGTGGGVVSSGGMLVDGGLTVSEALTTDATGTIAVKGFLVEDGSGARLCEALAESYPPQCGGASIPVIGYEEVLSAPVSTAEGVTWTDVSVSLLGEIGDGTLVVDATVSG
jgi:hypothetical protein